MTSLAEVSLQDLMASLSVPRFDEMLLLDTGCKCPKWHPSERLRAPKQQKHNFSENGGDNCLWNILGLGAKAQLSGFTGQTWALCGN